MNTRDAAREMPAALKAVAAERANYRKAIHEARWAEGPVYIVGQGGAIRPARAAAQAFERLLEWPALAREASSFLNHSLATLRPRATLLVVSANGEEEYAAEVARRASRRGACVCAVTSNPQSSVAQSARVHLLLPPATGRVAAVSDPVLSYTALFEVASAAAGIFNPRLPDLGPLENDFDRLPELVPWMEIHLLDPLRSCANRMAGSRRKVMAGAGLYYSAASEAAALARQSLTGIVEEIEIGLAEEFPPETFGPEDALLFISSSSSREKKAACAQALRLSARSPKLFALTDGNDQQLIQLCELSLLLPHLGEIPGALLSMVLLQWLILELAALDRGSGRAKAIFSKPSAEL